MTRNALRQAASVTEVVLAGRIAELLADHGEAGLTSALDLVVGELGLRSAVLREAEPLAADGPARGGGHLRAVAGDAVHAVPAMREDSAAACIELPIELTVRAGGRDTGVLSLVGARPSQLPVLRAVAAVLSLALSRPTRSATPDSVDAVVAAADAEADAAADLLHDGPVQALAVAHYAAEAAVRGGDPAAARQAVQAALVELRRSLWHLRPRGSAGLPGALGLLSARLEEAGRPPVGFVLDELLAAALPRAVVSTAYRLVQAVAVPLGGDAVRVTLRREAAAAVLQIEGGVPLVDVDRWADKACALGGALTALDGSVRLAVPLALLRPKATP